MIQTPVRFRRFCRGSFLSAEIQFFFLDFSGNFWNPPDNLGMLSGGFQKFLRTPRKKFVFYGLYGDCVFVTSERCEIKKIWESQKSCRSPRKKRTPRKMNTIFVFLWCHQEQSVFIRCLEHFRIFIRLVWKEMECQTDAFSHDFGRKKLREHHLELFRIAFFRRKNVLNRGYSWKNEGKLPNIREKWLFFEKKWNKNRIQISLFPFFLLSWFYCFCYSFLYQKMMWEKREKTPFRWFCRI